MKVYIPNAYDNRYVQHHHNMYVVIPLSGRSTDLPQELVEEKYDRGNNVCHVKMLSARLFTESGDPILWGWKALYDSSVSQKHYRVYYFAQYFNRCAVYCQCTYQTDTFGQRINGSRYHWEMHVYGEETRSSGSLRRLEGYHRFGVNLSVLGAQTPRTDAVSSGMKLSGLAKVLSDHLAYQSRFPSYMFNDNPGDSSLIRIFSEGINYYLGTFFEYDGPINSIGSWGRPEDVRSRAVVHLPTSSLLSKLRFDEYNLLLVKAYSAKPFAAYHVKALQQAAYLDCMDHVPQMNDNNIANILEVVQFLKGIIIDHKVDIPDSLSSLWLSYRYTYGTGKSDLENAIQFQKRVVDGVLFHQGFACYGVSEQTLSGVSVTCRCHIRFRQKELDYLEKISTGLYRYGLTPSFYVIWDLIPYSFIVDWFIPIGDTLNAIDERRMYERTYDMSDIWFSLKYEFQDEDGVYTAYTRWGSSCLPEFQSYYSLENIGSPSQKTIGYRILDASSLLFR